MVAYLFVSMFVCWLGSCVPSVRVNSVWESILVTTCRSGKASGRGLQVQCRSLCFRGVRVLIGCKCFAAIYVTARKWPRRCYSRRRCRPQAVKMVQTQAPSRAQVSGKGKAFAELFFAQGVRNVRRATASRLTLGPVVFFFCSSHHSPSPSASPWDGVGLG